MDVVRVAEDRKAQGHPEDVAHSLTHLREELLPEPRDGVFIAGRGLVQLLFGLRLDEEPCRARTSSASVNRGPAHHRVPVRNVRVSGAAALLARPVGSPGQTA